MVDRVASLLLLYSTLAFVLVVLVFALLAYTPRIAWYLLSGTGDLSFLTQAEILHMADVQRLLVHALIIAAACVAALFLYQWRRGITSSIVRDALIMNGGLALLLIPFSWSFERFHNLLFPQGNWQFPIDSWLITHYPPTFFIGAAVLWLGGSAVLLLALRKHSM